MTARSAEHQALGRAVRVLRVYRDHTQASLGDASGLHRNYIGAIERGEINPTYTVLLKVARGLGASVSQVIGCAEEIAAGGERTALEASRRALGSGPAPALAVERLAA